MLLFNFVPANLNNSFQKWLKKILSRSNTVDCLITSFTNNFATVLASKGCLMWESGHTYWNDPPPLKSLQTRLPLAILLWNPLRCHPKSCREFPMVLISLLVIETRIYSVDTQHILSNISVHLPSFLAKITRLLIVYMFARSPSDPQTLNHGMYEE